MSQRKLWIAFGLVVGLSFAVLLYYGAQIYQQAPPVPERVVDENGNLFFTGDDIKDGQNVWQSIGGQEVGTIWGHGAYVAPDWNADWLHREAMWILNKYAKEQFGKAYDALDEERQAMLRARLKKEIRTNTYQEETGDLVLSPIRAEAVKAISRHYA